MSKITISTIETFVAALEEHRRFKRYAFGKDKSATNLCAALEPLAHLLDIGEHPALLSAVASIARAVELATERTGRSHLQLALVEAHVALADEIVEYASPALEPEAIEAAQ